MFQGLWPVRAAQLPREIIAGITLAALTIPEAMGYTKIAGMPVVTGLYTAVVPMALFAIFGSSRRLVVGADSATAAILSAGLAGLAVAGSPRYVALASSLALMVAGCLIVARVIRLGFLADFLSRTVLIGFLNGVGIQVAVAQIPGLFGLDGGEVKSLLAIFGSNVSFNPYASALAAAAVVLIVGSRVVARRLPAPLLVVMAAIAGSWSFNWHSYGIHTLGIISGGVPVFRIPGIGWSWSLFKQLMPVAFSMFVVILAQSAATSRAYAARHNESVNENVDLVGLAAANLGAGLCSTFVVNGSPTKTEVVEAAGGGSQLAQLVTALVVLLVLQYLTPALAYLPTPVLSALVLLIGLRLIDARETRKIYFERRWEFWVALTTTTVVLVAGVQQGILLAVVLSLLVHTRHGYRPKNVVLVDSGKGYWNTRPVSSAAQVMPGLIIYRFTHSMYYANRALLQSEVLELIDNARQAIQWFCIDAGAVDDLDFSAAETLRGLAGILTERRIRLVFAVVSDDVRQEMDCSGITSLLDRTAYYPSVGEVVSAFARSTKVNEHRV